MRLIVGGFKTYSCLDAFPHGSREFYVGLMGRNENLNFSTGTSVRVIWGHLAVCVCVRAYMCVRACVCVRACARARFACLQPHRFRAVTLLVEILASAFSLPCITSVLRLSSVQPTRPTLVAGSVNWLVASLKAPRNRNAI